MDVYLFIWYLFEDFHAWLGDFLWGRFFCNAHPCQKRRCDGTPSLHTYWMTMPVATKSDWEVSQTVICKSHPVPTVARTVLWVCTDAQDLTRACHSSDWPADNYIQICWAVLYHCGLGSPTKQNCAKSSGVNAHSVCRHLLSSAICQEQDRHSSANPTRANSGGVNARAGCTQAPRWVKWVHHTAGLKPKHIPYRG